MSPRYDAIRPAAMLPAEVVNDSTSINLCSAQRALPYRWIAPIGLYFLKRDLDKLLAHLDSLNDDPEAIKAVEAERMRIVEEQENVSSVD